MTKLNAKQIVVNFIKKIKSIDDLKKIVSSTGKNHISLVNQEAMKRLQSELSEDEYNSFISTIQD